MGALQQLLAANRGANSTIYLSDDFSGASVDTTTRWSKMTSNYTMSQSTGTLKITGTGSSLDGLVTKTTWDVRDRYCQVQLVTAQVWTLFVLISTDGTKYCSFEVVDAGGGFKNINYNYHTTGDDKTFETYSAGTHVWLRFFYNSSTQILTWWTSADGSSWTSRRTKDMSATGFPFSGCNIRLQYNSNSVSIQEWDNFSLFS